jgi:hypothetical protein
MPAPSALAISHSAARDLSRTTNNVDTFRGSALPVDSSGLYGGDYQGSGDHDLQLQLPLKSAMSPDVDCHFEPPVVASSGIYTSCEPQAENEVVEISDDEDLPTTKHETQQSYTAESEEVKRRREVSDAKVWHSMYNKSNNECQILREIIKQQLGVTDEQIKHILVRVQEHGHNSGNAFRQAVKDGLCQDERKLQTQL